MSRATGETSPTVRYWGPSPRATQLLGVSDGGQAHELARVVLDHKRAILDRHLGSGGQRAGPRILGVNLEIDDREVIASLCLRPGYAGAQEQDRFVGDEGEKSTFFGRALERKPERRRLPAAKLRGSDGRYALERLAQSGCAPRLECGK